MPHRALDLVDVHVAVHEPHVVAIGHHELADILIVLVRDLADDLLREVFEREDAREAAVLVDHAGELIACRRELREGVGQSHEGGQHDRGAHELRHGRLAVEGRLENVDEVDDAERLLVVTDHRVAGVGRRHELANLGERRTGAGDVDLRARNHRVLDVLLREVEDAVEHE